MSLADIQIEAAAWWLAHAGEHHGEASWWARWNFDPLLLALLLLTAAWYGRGVAVLWRRAGRGRGISRRRAGAFAGGLLALVAALVSPIDALAAELSWVHMVQHMVLMTLAAPLLALGAPGVAMLWALPRGGRAGLGRWAAQAAAWRWGSYLLWQPLLLWSLHALVLWLWHWPVLYEAALRQPVIHDLQHAAFLTAAYLFWRVLLDPLGRLGLGPGAGVLYLFTTSLHATLLGVFMALSPRVWYAPYQHTAPAWGLSALEDQQLAGYIMWMPACLAYALGAALILGLWLRDAEHAAFAAPRPWDPLPAPATPAPAAGQGGK